jgi:hypothetical protein
MQRLQKPKLIIFTICVYTLSILALAAGPMIPKVHAVGEVFTFFMKPSAEAAIVQSIQGNQLSFNEMAQTAIYGMDGQFGATPIIFKYVSGPATFPGNFIYEATYFCNGAGDTSRNQTTDFPTQITVRITAPLTKGFVVDGAGSGPGASFGIMKAQISSPQSGNVVPKCLPTGIPSTVNVSSFKHLLPAAQASFGTLLTTAEVNGIANAANPANAGGAGASNPDCQSGGHPLGWILCPIIDGGAAFTDWVFTTFIRGILEDVPINIDENDGGYRAWQNFRVVGNSILIMTLLAIVYAQVKGGGGR